MAVLLRSLASLTPFAPFLHSTGLQSSPWLSICPPGSHCTPFAADFQFHRGKRDHQPESPPSSCILRMHLLSCCQKKPFSISVHSSEIQRPPPFPLHPPIAITLSHSPSKSHLLPVSNFPVSLTSASLLLLPRSQRTHYGAPLRPQLAAHGAPVDQPLLEACPPPLAAPLPTSGCSRRSESVV